MGTVTAVFHNGRIELASPVDWPDGTPVEVKPIAERVPVRPRERVVFPLQRSTQPDSLTVEQVRAAEESAVREEDVSRAGSV